MKFSKQLCYCPILQRKKLGKCKAHGGILQMLDMKCFHTKQHFAYQMLDMKANACLQGFWSKHFQNSCLFASLQHSLHQALPLEQSFSFSSVTPRFSHLWLLLLGPLWGLTHSASPLNCWTVPGSSPRPWHQLPPRADHCNMYSSNWASSLRHMHVSLAYTELKSWSLLLSTLHFPCLVLTSLSHLSNDTTPHTSASARNLRHLQLLPSLPPNIKSPSRPFDSTSYITLESIYCLSVQAKATCPLVQSVVTSSSLVSLHLFLFLLYSISAVWIAFLGRHLQPEWCLQNSNSTLEPFHSIPLLTV